MVRRVSGRRVVKQHAGASGESGLLVGHPERRADEHRAHRGGQQGWERAPVTVRGRASGAWRPAARRPRLARWVAARSGGHRT